MIGPLDPAAPVSRSDTRIYVDRLERIPPNSRRRSEDEDPPPRPLPHRPEEPEDEDHPHIDILA